MSADLQGLIAAQLETPGDAAARSALIDLLLERDDPRAELLRVVPALHARPFFNADHPRLYRKRRDPWGRPVFTTLRLPPPYNTDRGWQSARLPGVAALDELLHWGRSCVVVPAFRRHLAARELYACGVITLAWRDAVLLNLSREERSAGVLWGHPSLVARWREMFDLIGGPNLGRSLAGLEVAAAFPGLISHLTPWDQSVQEERKAPDEALRRKWPRAPAQHFMRHHFKAIRRRLRGRYLDWIDTIAEMRLWLIDEQLRQQSLPRIDAPRSAPAVSRKE